MSAPAPAPELRASLPAELTEFLGRRLERAEVRARMSGSRLVTLTGLGGVGKTRLALRVANDLRRSMRDGVWFIPLAELSDAELIPEVVASALGIHDRSSEFGLVRLTDHLSTREILLVLDNCEHLIDGCATVVDALLRTCPRLRILATSRESLRIAGEVVHPVAPLSVPDSATELVAVHDYEAVRLFVQRVRQVVPGFEVTAENRSAVLEICRHLEGIPLALELAAIRMRAMSPDELLERLREHWELLDLGNRNAPERHRTMAACIEWSYQQCSPAERGMWDRLSIFAGGAEIDAIHSVESEADPAATPQRTADLAQALVDKSILSIELTDGRTQFRMHEVLRQHGIGQLVSAGAVSTTRRAVLSFYTNLLDRIDEDWMSPRQIDWMRRLRREEANFRVALEFACTKPGAAPTGLELAARLRKYAMAYGAFTEVRHWLKRLLSLVPEADAERLRGLRAACVLAALQGDRAVSAAFMAEADELADRLGPPATWLADQAAGWHHMFSGDLEECIAALARALAVLEQGGNLRDIAETHTLMGMAYGFAGDLPRAAASHQASLDICESAGESWCRSFSLWNLGLVVWAGGDLVRAVALERESLELKRRMDDRLGLALCLEACAWMHAEESPARAATLLGAADRLWDFMATSLEVLPGLTPMRQRCEEALRDSLGHEAFSAAQTTGAGMDSFTAIAFALDERPAPSRSVRRAAPSGPARLTKREQQVAELVATGLTNEAIANKLVISRRTVESHVEHILTKLGFTSRTQLAVWVADSSQA
ncbi:MULTISPECIES: ATP-binding protein [Nocardioides]|uniref:ATP-binding protein n=1 Tax=Nocardioides vastitatis TaxID=2568655 RepID=A0ABW0ZMR5_9ACTN|nr:LuxR C-terminal-related transcriptional regulator [Nocardioides sp.]THJ16037.1 LuxR family transcriptional regulator [Nocardioides sp.]